MDEVLSEFLVESGEMLDSMERELVAFEAGDAGPDAIRTVFRAIHTIKGTCGFLGMQRLQALTHAGENLLSDLRDGKLSVSAEITSALLALVDAVRRSLAVIEATGAEGDTDFSGLVERLGALQKPGPAPAAAPPPPAKPEPPAAALAASPVSAASPTLAAAPASTAAGEGERGEAGSSPEAPAVETSASASTIRVGVNLLDKLMNLVGELVLARNQVLSYAAAVDDTVFAATSQRLNLLTTELQENVMKARMQPIGNILSKFPRVVRDLARETGKQARVEIVGAETELDKTIIEAIKDPLTHLVRNAVDHGLEKPEQRLACGKPAEGKVLLRAFHEGGQVNIEIIDDGAGVNLERVRKKALERGLVTAEQAASASEREVVKFLFLPGFSTAEKITSVSGRGVGMDVVKTNVEKIGGTVELQTVTGVGITIKIKIPLTLAIIPALIVGCGGERYAIPQGSLLEVVRLEGEKLRRGIERVHQTPVYRLRGRLLPLVYMGRSLGTVQREPPAGAEAEVEAVNIVVLQSDHRQFGLVVDSIEDTQEIVVKPLEQGLKSIPIFAGSTIMGDGRVALILDVVGIAQRAHVIGEASARAAGEEELASARAAAEERQPLLILDAQHHDRMAIPLAQVRRLEEFPLSAVERAGGQEVVQYRGQIMPLVRVGSALPERRAEPRSGAGGDEIATIQVVVYRANGRDIGLVVDRILDVVEDSLKVRRPPSRPGVLFSVVIASRVTEMLDLEALVRAADPTLLEPAPSTEAGS